MAHACMIVSSAAWEEPLQGPYIEGVRALHENACNAAGEVPESESERPGYLGGRHEQLRAMWIMSDCPEK